MSLVSLPYTGKKKGIFKKYKKGLRQLNRKKPFKNKYEEQFRVLMETRKLNLTKRGFPDFMVYDDWGNVLAFVEVKPRKSKKLSEGQKLFQKFCKQRNIPFYKWTPEIDVPLYK